MNNFGKIIWLTLVGLMVAVLATQYKISTEDEAKQMSLNKDVPCETQGINEDLIRKINLTTDGQYKLSTTIISEADPTIISNDDGTAWLEVWIFSDGYDSYAENRLKDKEVKTTLNGLKYWESTDWCSTLPCESQRNLHREFFIQDAQGEVLVISEYDNKGGEQEEEFEALAESIGL